MIDRREFLAGLAAVGAARATGAQPARKVYRIGVLGSASVADMVGPEPPHSSVRALLRGLRDLGHVFGQEFLTEPRGSPGHPDRYPALAAELVLLVRAKVLV